MDALILRKRKGRRRLGDTGELHGPKWCANAKSHQVRDLRRCYERIRVGTGHTKDQDLSTKEIYLPKWDKEQGIRVKDRRQRTREKRKGTREGGRDICLVGKKNCHWIDRRQMCSVGKWQFIKGKRETMC